MKILRLSEVPASVYRLQLSGDFPLKKAIKILPYLHDLGIEGVYCSPFYDSYSPHGYDITNPNMLNPQIGTLEIYRQFCTKLKKLGLKQIIDVVPNHMGFKGGKNKWWQDVLEKGPHSNYASFFDINWNPEKQELKNRVLLPILGTSYGEALENGTIQLRSKKGKFWLEYGDYPLPLAPHTYEMIPKDHSKLSPEILDTLLEAQYYRLSYWRVASHEINYRRFFNIHELVAIRIEDKRVLEAHHKWLFKLIEDGYIQGIRIDHPDGLFDPVAYFNQLKERGSPCTIVEKILDREEHLPQNWNVEGTVGYEYLNVLNGVFIDQDNEQAFNKIYEDFIETVLDFEEVVYQSKKFFVSYEMVSEVAALGLKLDRLSEQNCDYRDFTRHDLTKALAEVIACFPVYRTYIEPKGKVRNRDSHYIKIAIKKAKEKARDLDPSLFDFLDKLLHIQLKDRKKYREFVLQFQQLTGPIMAKGLEDTAFYIYNRFISLNEVGGDPPYFGYSIEQFHCFNQEKRKKWPLGFLASSTHDTKRNEDVRARLNVLSEMPEKWQKWIRRFKGEGPSLNAQYLIFQLLFGWWPAHSLKKEEHQILAERLWTVVLKSIREAKQETSWMFPNSTYEENVRAFLYKILSSEKENTLLKKVEHFGALNSLSATLLKLGSCGIVDIYQGNELLNYSLVDPDNRRAIDFEFRKKELSIIKKSDPVNLYNLGEFSRLKLFMHWKVLNFRKQHRALFLEGEYLLLKVKGAQKEHVIAFMRTFKKQALIIIVGRFFSSLLLNLGKTEVVLPKQWASCQWHSLFTDQSPQTFLIADIFQPLPFTLIYGEKCD